MNGKIAEVLLRDLNKEALTFEKLKGGRNSQVFRVDCADGSTFAAKAYFQDNRDRMGREFRALEFLKKEGVREVAAPLAADETRRVAIHEFIHGKPPRIGGDEIDRAVRFLGELKRIADSARPAHFPPASEACFSIGEILQNIDGRLARLLEASAAEPELADFLRNDLLPFRKAAGKGVPADSEIPLSGRTLSPSDFGFHNALQRADGGLVFLDFEYFGWDDPAKTIVDFLLHPAMRLPPPLKARFLSGMLSAFASIPGLGERARAVYPLFGIKWCAILLNEFTLEHMARRCFADSAAGAWSGAAQLEKARRMLALVKEEFPLHG